MDATWAPADALPAVLSDRAVRVVCVKHVDWTAWEAFALRCGAGLRSAAARLQALRWMGLEVYEVYAGPKARKVGQCAVIRRSGRTVFYDGLQILPEHQALWPAAMAAVLRRLGPGRYRYGWEWSLEKPRHDQLAAIRGLRVTQVRSVIVQGIDFSRWPDWSSYLASVRKTCRYEARAAERRHPGLRLTVHAGLASLADAPGLILSQVALFRHKHVAFHAAGAIRSLLLQTLTSPGSAFIATARAGSKGLAAFQGAEFGTTTYYLSGARAPGVTGAGWRLLLWLAERAFQRNPRGKFLLGFADSPARDPLAAEGILLSRRGLRVSDWPTSRVDFHWSGSD